LSASGKHRVTVLEAGGSDRRFFVNLPLGYGKLFYDPNVNWMYQTEPDPGLAGNRDHWPRGKILGGSSSINAMVWIRGNKADYQAWGAENPGWGWDEVLPYFKKHEDYADGADDLHGTGGEWKVQNQRLHWEILDDWLEAAHQAGLPKTDDFNRGDNEGVGYFKVNQNRGWRWNTSKAFLRPAADRLLIETQAQVTRLEITGGRATGVVYRQNGAQRIAHARAEVILSAGAIGSPQILQVSGIGPAAHLQDMGINVVAESPEIGHNLQDHLQIRCAYKVSGFRTLNTLSASLAGKALIAAEYALRRSGPMSMSPSQLGAFAKSRPDLDTPDLEYHVQPLSLEAFGGDLDPFDAITASVCNLRPESRGTVMIAAPDARKHPQIRPNYLSTEADRLIAAESIRLTRAIMGQPALAKYRPEEFKPGPQLQSDADLAVAAGTIGTTIFHPVGTVRMGSDARAPVSPQLRVNGVDGLRVVDASIMPRITSGNTNAPTLMIAEKAADMILRGE